MSYRDDVMALTERREALAGEVARKERELAEASRLLEEARARARLPVLDGIRVASPCRADWKGMTGDDRVRHCGDCRRNVYNLSGLTRDGAEALIAEKEGRLCVRYYQRADGTILFRDDCEPGVARQERRRRRRHGVIAGAIAMLVGAAGVLGWRLTRRPALAAAAEAEAVEADVRELERRGREMLGKYDGAPRGAPVDGYK